MTNRLLALLLLFTSTGCQLFQGKPEPMAVIASSGSFEAAMQGVHRVTLHPRVRVVRPLPGQASTAELQREMDRALVEALKERGLAVVARGFGAERTIAYALGVEGELTDAEMVELFGISPGLDSGTDELRAGIVLAVVHTRTGQVLWRGSGSAARTRENTGSKRYEAILHAVRSIIAGHTTTP